MMNKMTLAELEQELAKWQKEWETDLTDNPYRLEYVSNMIDHWMNEIKLAQRMK